MQIMLMTSRSVNKDRFYQSQQDKRHQIHLKKIKNISQTPLQPIKVDTTYQKNLKRAKSAAKLFQQQQNKLVRRIQNNVLLTKLINIQPTYKALRIKKSLSKQKLTGTLTNFTFRRKQSEKLQKQHQVFLKKCDTISNVNVKDVKKKLQQEIKQYLELRNNIRKIKPLSSSQSNKKLRSISFKKISMGLPLYNTQNNQAKNQQQQVKKISDQESQNKKVNKQNQEEIEDNIKNEKI